jgi:Zn-dependent protease with chaperone function
MVGSEVSPNIRNQPGAIFFDGRTSRRRQVHLWFGFGLEIREDGMLIAEWAYRDISQVDAPNGLLRLKASTGPDLARLEVADAHLKQEIVTRCDLLARPPKPGGGLRVMIALSLAALGSVAVILWFGIPYAADHLAPLVPAAWEKRLGGAVEGQVRTIFPGRACAAPAGKAALAKLTDALQKNTAIRIAPSVEIVGSSVANAFALPGGKVFLFRGLLDKAQSPDEIAGVLGHEFGHLQHRDHLRRLMANGGTAYILGLLFGDVSGAGALLFTTRTLLGAAYSRDAEAAADGFAADTLVGLGRSTIPMGQLLVRISGRAEDSSFTLLRDHPLSDARLEELRRRDRGNTGPPLLSDQEWAALKAICA